MLGKYRFQSQTLLFSPLNQHCKFFFAMLGNIYVIILEEFLVSDFSKIPSSILSFILRNN